MRSDLPSGTVTLLMTDIEGSTRMLERLGVEAYAGALHDHRRIIRDAIQQREGVEVDAQGDAFLVAFPTAAAAVGAAAAIRDGLEPTQVRVRIGIHTGTPTMQAEGYVGPDLHLAARITNAAHGGQIVLSAATAGLVDPGDPDMRLLDLGAHRLKDISAPQRLYQLGDARFPALRSLRPGNLPAQVTSFIGRAQELARLHALLVDPATRLVTLTGPGGSGKTRLALRAAAASADGYPDGAWWVALASLDDPALVSAATVAALGGMEDLDAWLAPRRTLLVFDNFEHLLPAATLLSHLLEIAPALSIIVTSRERLHLAAELEFPVGPLTSSDAATFFVARAQTPDMPGPDDPTVQAICRQLDDLPLALELAAARARTMPIHELLARLDRGLAILTGGPRDAPDRQRTLRATIEWSIGLCTVAEREALARLAVFAGGWSLGAAEQVAATGLDTLTLLAERSLIGLSGGRYSMLRTIRELALAAPTGPVSRTELAARHLAWCLALAGDAEPRLTGPDQAQWYARLDLEQNDIRAALRFALDSGSVDDALQLSGLVWRYWWSRGRLDEAWRWYTEAFEAASRPGVAPADLPLARARFGAGHVAESRGDVARTRELLEAAIPVLRAHGELRWLILALTHLGGTLRDPVEQQRVQEEALALALESGDRRGVAVVRSNMSFIRSSLGDLDGAVELQRLALADHRALRDTMMIANGLSHLGAIALMQGDLGAAASSVAEGLLLATSIGNRLEIAQMLPVAALVIDARGGGGAAARILGAQVQLATDDGLDPAAVAEVFTEDAEERLRRSLGPAFDAAFQEGRSLDADEAVRQAVDLLSDGDASGRQSGARTPGA